MTIVGWLWNGQGVEIPLLDAPLLGWQAGATIGPIAAAAARPAH